MATYDHIVETDVTAGTVARPEFLWNRISDLKMIFKNRRQRKSSFSHLLVFYLALGKLHCMIKFFRVTGYKYGRNNK